MSSLLNFNIYYIGIVIRNVWYRLRDEHINQNNRTENPEIDPHKYAQLIFYEDAITVQWRKDSLFNK